MLLQANRHRLHAHRHPGPVKLANRARTSAQGGREAGRNSRNARLDSPPQPRSDGFRRRCVVTRPIPTANAFRNPRHLSPPRVNAIGAAGLCRVGPVLDQRGAEPPSTRSPAGASSFWVGRRRRPYSPIHRGGAGRWRESLTHRPRRACASLRTANTFLFCSRKGRRTH